MSAIFCEQVIYAHYFQKEEHFTQ